jgi:transglutaminase-like putative cysteine protease
MRFDVEHLTTYRYSAPVTLGPQTVRLRPRPDGSFREIGYSLLVDPAPAVRSELLDAEGNLATRLWFEAESRYLNIVSRFTLDVHEAAPPAVILAASGRRLPVDYPEDEAPVLAPYRGAAGSDGPVAALAADLRARAASDPVAFLALLTEHLHRTIGRKIRDQGAPQPPAETLTRRRGACRDQTLLFVAVARAAGFAARFVSGYQDRSAISTGERHLHAWPEAYLPGCGWRGFDPTRGIATGGGHVAVAAARDPAGAMPVTGTYFGTATSDLTYEVRIRTAD